MVGTLILAILLVLLAWKFQRVARRFSDDIAMLKRENLITGKAVVAHMKRLEALEEQAKRVPEPEKQLTPEPVKTKIVTKPRRWGQFASAAEKASELQEKQ